MSDTWTERFKLPVADDAAEIALATMGDSGPSWVLSATSIGGLRLELNLRRSEVEALVAKLAAALAE